MCGIAGIVDRGGMGKFHYQSVRNMIAIQRHRGPDGEGFYDSTDVSLGHCRLAIIGLGETGHQPMGEQSGRFWITFNGEIYNYIELGEELKALGQQIVGKSDTEVLLRAYCQWGQECVVRLRGMFAFAIWDEREKTLFAARDRLGIKPFHYCLEGSERLAFSSELKALLALMPERKINVALARDYLAWNLLDHHESETMLEGIFRLPPAHTMFWRSGEGLQLKRYWVPPFNEELIVSPLQETSLISEFRKRFEESIAIHLRADVPVGTCLSGGLDSSSIVCAMSAEIGKWRHSGRENFQHTFSAYFDEPDLDERSYAQAVISKAGCIPHYVKPHGEELLEDLDNWLWHLEEPVGGFGAYVQYCVFKLSKQNSIKVLLDGQGADEQLAGYRKFILVFLRQLFKEKQYFQFSRETLAFFSSFDILRTTRLAEGRRYLFGTSTEIAKLWPGEQISQPPVGLGLKVSLGRRLNADITHFSLPVLLRYEDRNSMAFGIESRVPFLDHPLVEFLGTLPANMKLRGGWTKWILREALEGLLPEMVRARKSKLGFSSPEAKWLAGPLENWLQKRLEKPRHLRSVVDVHGVQYLLEQRMAGNNSRTLQNVLFRLAIYESWANLFLGDTV